MKVKSDVTDHEVSSPLSAQLSKSSKARTVDDQITVLGEHAGKVTISFHRTIRVPDNNDKNYLPPSLGNFPLYSVSSFRQKMPPEMFAKGGIFFPMYRK